MTYQDIILEFVANLAIITLNRPEKHNALSYRSVTELADALTRVAGSSARAIILTGAGRSFCSGADLSIDFQAAKGPRDMGAGLENYFNPLLEQLLRLNVPVVVAVNGAAVGGGCSYALASDIVIAGRSAFFLQSFVKIGLVPDVGATWLLPRLVGRARATAMMMLGDRVSAQQALEWGLIHDVVDDDSLMLVAREIADRLASGPTLVNCYIRHGIAAGLEQSLSETLAMEREHQRLAGLTADFIEGVSAFRQKRQPQFIGE